MTPKPFAGLLVLLLVLPLFIIHPLPPVSAQTSSSLYFGVDVAFENVSATEQLIDTISAYTNFFVFGCTGSYNDTRLTSLCQYAFDKGLTFIVYTDDPHYPSAQWFTNARASWGDKFLGLYYGDEVGGKQLDQQGYPLINASSVPQEVIDSKNYTYVADQYVSTLSMILHGPAITRNFANSNYQLFTSDYSLYWYDYEAGYDTVFAEFTMNYSRQINIDLCRGAATAQNKDWGIMITWANDPTPTTGPGPESGTDLYNDLVLAYQNNAKYIIVFDSNANYTENVLQQPQFDAMKQFWQYAQQHPRTTTPLSEKSVYILPTDYAYGFRSPTQDRIWGVWDNDSLTLQISMSIATLFQIFGNNIDIVYPDSTAPVQSLGYKNIVYWNDPRLIAPTDNSTQNGTQTSTPSPLLGQNGFWTAVAVALSVVVIVAVCASILRVKVKHR